MQICDFVEIIVQFEILCKIVVMAVVRLVSYTVYNQPEYNIIYYT